MPRLKLVPRDDYPFTCDITVRTTDLNYGGHLGNDRLLSLVHEARVAFLASFELSELDLYPGRLRLGAAREDVEDQFRAVNDVDINQFFEISCLGG